MKFAFMSFSCPELTLDEMLALAQKLGYDAIEPRAQSGHAHGVELDATAEQRRQVRETIQDSPIELCCVAVSCCFADPAGLEENLAQTHQAIDLAGDLECDRVRVFGGGIGQGISREDAIGNVAAALASVAQHADQRGVTLCLETHDDWRDPTHVAELLGRVDHPRICVNWDIMHPILAGAATIEESFETLKPWIQHVHVHDGRQESGGACTLVPIGQGDIDHTAALRCLKQSGYDGAISGEWIGWEPHEVHLPRELALLKALI